MTSTVCNCNQVTYHDVRKFKKLYPDCSEKNAKVLLNVGTRCGCCLIKDCPVTDYLFEDVWNIK